LSDLTQLGVGYDLDIPDHASHEEAGAEVKEEKGGVQGGRESHECGEMGAEVWFLAFREARVGLLVEGADDFLDGRI
jgi:hypothetical protein